METFGENAIDLRKAIADHIRYICLCLGPPFFAKKKSSDFYAVASLFADYLDSKLLDCKTMQSFVSELERSAIQGGDQVP